MPTPLPVRCVICIQWVSYRERFELRKVNAAKAASQLRRGKLVQLYGRIALRKVGMGSPRSLARSLASSPRSPATRSRNVWSFHWLCARNNLFSALQYPYGAWTGLTSA